MIDYVDKDYLKNYLAIDLGELREHIRSEYDKSCELLFSDNKAFIISCCKHFDGFTERSHAWLLVSPETNIVIVKCHSNDTGDWRDDWEVSEEVIVYLKGKKIAKIEVCLSGSCGSGYGEYIGETMTGEKLVSYVENYKDEIEVVKQKEDYYRNIKSKKKIATSVINKQNMKIIFSTPNNSVIMTENYIITTNETDILLLYNQEDDGHYLFKRGYGWVKITEKTVEKYMPEYNKLQKEIYEREMNLLYLDDIRDHKTREKLRKAIEEELKELLSRYHKLVEEIEKELPNDVFIPVKVMICNEIDYGLAADKMVFRVTESNEELVEYTIDSGVAEIIYEDETKEYFYVEKMLMIPKTAKFKAEYILLDGFYNKKATIAKIDADGSSIKIHYNKPNEENIIVFDAYDLSLIT